MIRVVKKAIKKVVFHYLPFFFKPIPKSKLRDEIGFVTLLCHRDVTMFLYGFYSLLYALQTVYPLYVVDDGTLTSDDRKRLNHYFPFVIIENNEQADKKMKRVLAEHPHLLQHRFDKDVPNYKRKLDVVLLNPFERFILIDPDMLFWKKPIEIVDWIAKKNKRFVYTAHNEAFFFKKFYPEFAFRKLLFKHLSLRMTGAFSSGLLLFPSKKIMNVPKLESFMKLFSEVGYATKHSVVEECLFGLLAAINNSECLDTRKYLVAAFWEELEQYSLNLNKRVMTHYGWETKEKFASQAISLALSQQLYTNLL